MGDGDGEFYPRGIAVGKSGNIYVADFGNHRVQKFTSRGVFLKKWGTRGSDDGQFYYPAGVVADNSGNVSRNLHRRVFLSPVGEKMPVMDISIIQRT